VHYRVLRNKHQRNEFLPSFVVPPRGRDEARACKIGQSEECEGDIFFGGASFPAEVIFSPSRRRRRRWRRRRRRRRQQRIITYEFQLQKTGLSLRVGTQFLHLIVLRLLRLLFCTVISQKAIERAVYLFLQLHVQVHFYR